MTPRHPSMTRSSASLCISLLSACLGPFFGAIRAESSEMLKEHREFPASPFVVDVHRPPYGAKGDGKCDDTQSLQSAINDCVGMRKVIYLPNGTYLISKTLSWPKKVGERENWGFTQFRGQSRDRTILKLKDATFPSPEKPGAMMWCGGFGSADWFHNYVENLTFDVGASNPGAIALQFYSNNSGAVRDCKFVAPSGSGLTGLDLAHRDMNGPLLVRNCEVVGFQRGIATAHAVNGQTFEHITLRGQGKLGFDNEGQVLSIRGLRSDNAVPALRTYGTVSLVEATLTGHDGASNSPAVINYNGGRIFLRDITTSGYGRALGDVKSPDWVAALRIAETDQTRSAGPSISEYCSEKPTSLFATPATSLRLPVKETPEAPWEEPSEWANVDAFGADPSGKADSSEAIQKAIDSGATTVFLQGSYNLRSTVTIRGKVRRLIGLGGTINYGVGLNPDFRLGDGDSPIVTIEHLAHVHGGLEVNTRRTLVLRSVSDCDLRFTSRATGGELFLEDVVTHDLKLRGQTVWARQLNIENEGTHLANEGGKLWILGYKTERGGTLIETRGGGSTEVLGGFSYTTTAGKLAPMFVNTDSSVFAFFAEVCFSGDPFKTLVRETRNGETRLVSPGGGHTTPYVGVPTKK